MSDYPTTNRPGRKPFSQQDCIRSLQIAAKSLRETLLTIHKYQTWRQSTNTPLNYPTDRTISSHFETWENALIQARILPPNEVGNLSERRLGQTVEALHQYAERNGFPTQAEWDEFAQRTSLFCAPERLCNTLAYGGLTVADNTIPSWVARKERRCRYCSIPYSASSRRSSQHTIDKLQYENARSRSTCIGQHSRYVPLAVAIGLVDETIRFNLMLTHKAATAKSTHAAIRK